MRNHFIINFLVYQVMQSYRSLFVRPCLLHAMTICEQIPRNLPLPPKLKEISGEVMQKKFLAFYLFLAVGIQAAIVHSSTDAPVLEPAFIEAIAQKYVAAVTERNYEAYLEALHPVLREIPEFSSEDTLTTANTTINELIKLGFNGKFEIVFDAEGNNEYGIPVAYAKLLDDNGQFLNYVIGIAWLDGAWGAATIRSPQNP